MPKVIEYILWDQMIAFLATSWTPLGQLTEKGYSCQHIILELIEYWREAFNSNDYVGRTAMDISNDFDNMPHGLLESAMRNERYISPIKLTSPKNKWPICIIEGIKVISIKHS